jgi:tRNA-specific 2-thiouridylase
MRIVVAMSGGVDSAVAALLLRRAGHDVHGLFMANWDEDDAYCTAARDFQDALAVARELGIPLHRVSFASEYRARVFEHFLAEHRAGRTPNPDVACNREIKFGLCLRHAERLGAERFATGHYARLEHRPEEAALLKARDTAKDQSYFLCEVERGRFARVLFPLGDLVKGEVRRLAREAGLPVFDKPDSTGICFIGERPFRDFLERYVPPEPGIMETPEGERVGTHRGLAFYTLGQRGGLELGGMRGHSEGAWYVAGKDTARNVLIVVQGADHPLLLSGALTTGPINWLAEPRETGRRLGVKVRYRQPDQAARFEARADGRARLVFDEPQRAVTPGQWAVLYEGNHCLGGGVIEAVEPAFARSRAA